MLINWRSADLSAWLLIRPLWARVAESPAMFLHLTSLQRISPPGWIILVHFPLWIGSRSAQLVSAAAAGSLFRSAGGYPHQAVATASMYDIADGAGCHLIHLKKDQNCLHSLETRGGKTLKTVLRNNKIRLTRWKAFLRKRLKNKKQGEAEKNCCHSAGKLKQYL